MDNKNLISFIGASGTFDPKDRFFGVGSLTVQKTGEITDKLHIIFQRVLSISQINRYKALQSLMAKKDYQSIISMLKRTRHFELKFDRISPVKISQYREMIRLFLNNPMFRFSVMIIDKQKAGYDNHFFSTTWDAYTSYVATLISNELINTPNKEMTLVLDQINKPRTATQSLEDTVLEKIQKRSFKYRDNKICKIVNAFRIESHSNLLMQLTDVLLGAVMYDFKDKANLISKKLKLKKEEVVKELRNGLNISSLASTFTKHEPVYFHVWEVEFNKKNGGSDK